MDSIDDWKNYFKSKSIIIETNLDLDRAMCRLDKIISSYISSTKGMIWKNGKINPFITIADLDTALSLLSKFGQANIDDAGSLNDPTRFDGTPTNTLFISQDAANLDEWSQSGNQNQGAQLTSVPSKDHSVSDNPDEKTMNIDKRMEDLIKLIDSVKK